jgi:hypothetical protein
MRIKFLMILFRDLLNGHLSYNNYKSIKKINTTKILIKY